MVDPSPSALASGDVDDNGGPVSFHTPDQGSVGTSAPPTPLLTSGKKRAASSYPDTDNDNDNDYEEEGMSSPSTGGLLGWIGNAVSSLTKRSRTSLDMMSRSAIKSVNGTPQEGSNEDMEEGGEGSAGTKLSKLNLNMKFDGGNGGGGGVVGGILRNAGRNHHHEQQQQQQKEPWLPLAEPTGGSIGRKAEEAPPPAKKTSFAASSSPYNAYAGLPDAALTDHAELPFSMGSDTTNSDKERKTSFLPSTPIRPYTKPLTGRRVATPGTKFPLSSSYSSQHQLRPFNANGRLVDTSAGSTPGLTRRLAAPQMTTAEGGRRMLSATNYAATGVGGGNVRLAAVGGGSKMAVPTTADRLGGTNGTLSANFSLGVGGGPIQPSRRSTVATTRMGGAGGVTTFRRRHQIKYKPMTRLLTAEYNPAPSNVYGNGRKVNSMMITDSTVEQILAENRNRMLSSTSLSNGRAEQGLFGGSAVTTTAERQLARTFQEEEAMMVAGALAASDVPVVTRVRMNRILGTGQTGGVRPSTNVMFPSSTTTNSAVFVNESSTRNDFDSFSTMGTSASMLGNSSIMTTAVPLAKKRAVTFRPPITSDAGASNTAVSASADDVSSIPYNTATLTPRVTSYGLRLTPCKSVIPIEEGKRIEALLRSDEWEGKAASDSQGYDDSIVTTPRKSGKKARTARSTPHPRKVAIDMSTPALLKKAESLANAMNATAEDSGPTLVNGATMANGGAPFNFMSGGAGASSFVSTPLAYTYNTKSAIATPFVKSPASPVAASASQSSDGASTAGFWSSFASKPGEWRCDTCYVKNLKEAVKCVSCQILKSGNITNLDGGTKSSTIAGAGAIGVGGFSFSGPSSSSTTGPSTGSKPFVSTGAGATPAKAKRHCDEGNDIQEARIGAGGFSFGAASSLNNGNLSGGFSFGGPATTAKPKTTYESSSKPTSSAGFNFVAPATAPTSVTNPSSSIGFNFGAPTAVPVSVTEPSSMEGFTFGTPALGEMKKVDPVSTIASNNGVFSLGASAVGECNEKHTSIFSFGVPPPVVAAAEKGDEGNASEPSKKKAMFGATSSPVPRGNGAVAPGSKTATEPPSSASSDFAIGGRPAGASATPVPPFAFGTASTPAPAAAKKNDVNTTTSNVGFNFRATPAPAPKPFDVAIATTPVAPFAFGASTTQASSTSGGAAFSFGVAPSSFTPATGAPPVNPPLSSVAGFAFGAGSTSADFGSSVPAAFGSAPGGFGNSSQLTTPATNFAFGAGLTPAAPSTAGFGTAPSFGFSSTPQPAALPATSTPGAFGFSGNPAATPTLNPGFASGATSFAATTSFMGAAATQSTNGGGGGGAFSIGTGGAKKTPGGRRIVKARRPPGAR